jgi:hypothetical protein
MNPIERYHNTPPPKFESLQNVHEGGMNKKKQRKTSDISDIKTRTW